MAALLHIKKPYTCMFSVETVTSVGTVGKKETNRDLKKKDS